MHVDEARIVDRQHAFDHAELTDDRMLLHALIADDFMSVGEDGSILGKADWIDHHAELPFHPFDGAEMDVRVYGQTAIVRSVLHAHDDWLDADIPATARASQVWVQSPGVDRWRLTARQVSPIALMAGAPRFSAMARRIIPAA